MQRTARSRRDSHRGRVGIAVNKSVLEPLVYKVDYEERL